MGACRKMARKQARERRSEKEMGERRKAERREKPRLPERDAGKSIRRQSIRARIKK